MVWRLRAICLGSLLAIFLFIGEASVLLRMYRLTEWLYKQGIRLCPSKKGEFISRLGFLYERTSQLEKAKECYAEACRLMPQEGFLHVELASVYERQNQTLLAIESYERGLQLSAGWGSEFKNEIQGRINKLKNLSR